MSDAVVLPDVAEKALAEWRDELVDRDWAKSEEAIAARLAKGAVDVDPALLEPPALAEPGEPRATGDDTSGEHPTASREIGGADRVSAPRLRDRASDDGEVLTDIARQIADGDEKTDDSDIVRFDGLLREAGTLGAAPAPPPDAPPANAQSGGRSTAFAAGVAVTALAAAVMIWALRPDGSHPRSASAPHAEQVPLAALPGHDGARVPRVEDTAPAPAAQGLSLGDLPQADSLNAAPEKAHKVAGAVAKAAAVPSATEAPGEEVALADEPEPEPSAPPAAAKPPEPPMVPAAERGDVPTKPSIGAVQVAVAGVLSSARACLAGQSAPSQATVVFASSGAVQRVAVSGPAAGTPAEGCLRTALGGAHVSPFAQASFSAPITVRPP